MRGATVDLILSLRAQYLANGASPLKHWDQISERIQASIRQTSTVDQWCSLMMRQLQLQSPSLNSASSIAALRSTVGVHVLAWQRMVANETGALMADARLLAEQRKLGRENNGPYTIAQE
jgi:hypothetical protein